MPSRFILSGRGSMARLPRQPGLHCCRQGSVPMTARTLLLTSLAMLAFAGNSLLCRVALRDTEIDPASFTALRLLAGALTLALLLRLRRGPSTLAGDWPGALALFAYAAAFSYAYVKLDAGAGALLLFAAVQLSMIAWGLFKGERLSPLQILGSALALAGLIGLLLPDARDRKSVV